MEYANEFVKNGLVKLYIAAQKVGTFLLTFNIDSGDVFTVYVVCQNVLPLFNLK